MTHGRACMSMEPIAMDRQRSKQFITLSLQFPPLRSFVLILLDTLAAENFNRPQPPLLAVTSASENDARTSTGLFHGHKGAMSRCCARTEKLCAATTDELTAAPI